MIFTKKQLKELNEMNKKIKEHFPDEYYIFPDGNILGAGSDKILDEKTLIKYNPSIDKLVTLGVSEVFIVYPERVHFLFSSKNKIKMGDISEPIIKNGKVYVEVAIVNEVQIGEVVSYSDVNIVKINKLIRRELNKSNTVQLSDAQFKLLYDKEMVPLTVKGESSHTLLMNRKMFKTFTHHTKNMIITVRCSDTDKRCTDGKFLNDVTITHIDSKTMQPTISISEYFMAIDIK